MSARVTLRGFIAGAALVASVAAASAEPLTEISGAGATFPYPIYAKWAETYAQNSGVKLNYQSIGSGGGVKQIQAKTVAFGASDAPLAAEELEKHGLMQFPTVMGGVVPVVNLPDVKAGELKLDGNVLAQIFMGKITKWNDAAIQALNAGLKLPDTNINVVHRADASGTTWIFTNYLSKASTEWADKLGNNTAIAWPAGMGGKGNEGVASYVGRIKGAIGYVEYAYALQNKMNYVQLRNREGQFVAPDSRSFQAAAANADWEHSSGFYMVLTDQPGAQSWPITGATFILVHKLQEKPQVGQAVLKFFGWAYGNGDKLAEQLDYVPMPDSVVKLVQQRWEQQIKDTDGKALWPVK